MLLISPYTRTLTKHLYTDLLPYLIHTFASIIWFYLGHSHPEIAQRAFEARKTELERDLAAAREEIEHQKTARRKFYKFNNNLVTEQKNLITKIGGLERKSEKATERAKHIERTAAGQTVAQWEQQENFLLTRVNEYESMIVQRDKRITALQAELQAGRKIWKGQDEYVKDFRWHGEDALRKEIHNMTLRNNEMQRKNFEQAQKVAAFERVLDVLHELARQDGEGGERLPVAVGFALALKWAGVDLRAVQVDEGRWEVLREFVARGMGRHLPVQPQSEYQGFRQCEAFAKMY